METLGINPADLGHEVESPARNRRRRVRHRAHTPAYAALNVTCQDRNLELNEVLNISEEGMALQSSASLSLNQPVPLCLDLSETGARIEAIARVVWLDAGKVGVCFPEMPQSAQHQLKKWLFLNAVMACFYHSAQAATAQPNLETAPETQFPPSTLVDSQAAAPADYTDTLGALAAVAKEVRALDDDLDRALQLIAERALAFLHGAGAAIALVSGSDMTCRASAGSLAPSIGATLHIGKGFSGECVRTGQTLRCQDTETDPLTDKESCRAMGIRSMIASPVLWHESTIGLLEVFSERPAAFRLSDELVLRRLAEMVSWSVHRAGSGPDASSRSAAPADDDEVYSEPPAESNPDRLSLARKILLAATTVTLVIALIWLAQPWNPATGNAQISLHQPSMVVSRSSPAAAPRDFDGMRKLAEQGDATAQFAVGAHFATGEDVPQDYTEAVRWFTHAAEQGHVGAQATLGAYYWSGRGVAPDLVRAYFWAVLAQTGGDDASKYRVAFLTSRMTRAQVLEAQQQANEWIKAHESTSSVAASQPK
jgi:putative methionine-R-sulfoxide reductase with GAF domain